MANPELKKATRKKNSIALLKLSNLVAMVFYHLALTKSAIFREGVLHGYFGGSVRLVDT